MTAVVSRSSTMAGPVKPLATPRSVRRYTGVSRSAAAVEAHGPGRVRLAVVAAEHRDGLDGVGGGERRQPPRHGLDADVGDRQAVDPPVLALEALDDLAVGDRPLLRPRRPRA